MNIRQNCARSLSFLSGTNPIHARFIPWRVGLALGKFVTSRPPTLCRIRVHNHEMYVDLRDEGVSTTLFLSGSWENFATRIMANEVQKGNVVLDIGANIGYHTLILAEKVGRDGRVFAFEPDPWNFRLLNMNIEVNDYHNIIPVQRAVSNVTGKGKLYLSTNYGTFGGHTMFGKQLNQGSHPIEVETTRLDDYFKDEDRRIDFLKMDIQGAEFAALQGMTSIISDNKLKIIMEFIPSLLRSIDVQPNELLDWLLTNGFEIFEMDEGARTLRRIDAPQEYNRPTNLLLRKM